MSPLKRTILLFAAILISGSLFAQVPFSFNYQAVLRNEAGQVISSENVNIGISLLQGSADGTEVFSETHNTQTNEFGLINLQIGSVNSLSGIDWSGGELFISISLDGNLMGTTQLLSVPFALHAGSSGNAFSGDYNHLTNTPDLTSFIEISDPQYGDLVYFSNNSWHVLSPGLDQQVLTIVDGIPQWADIPEGGGNVDEPGTVSDIDGNIYPVVEIGNQVWMAENYRSTRYADGTLIPTNLTNSEWAATAEGAWTVFPHGYADGINSDEEMIAAYGALYNWHTTVDSRGLCPAGWRVPTGFDWLDLTSYITGQNPDNIGNQLKSCRQVNSPLGEDCLVSAHPRWNNNNNHHGTDAWDFAGFPASARTSDGSFIPLIGHMVTYWSTNEFSSVYAFTWGLYVSDGAVTNYNNFSKNYGFSVRCIKE